MHDMAEHLASRYLFRRNRGLGNAAKRPQYHLLISTRRIPSGEVMAAGQKEEKGIEEGVRRA